MDTDCELLCDMLRLSRMPSLMAPFAQLLLVYLYLHCNKNEREFATHAHYGNAAHIIHNVLRHMWIWDSECIIPPHAQIVFIRIFNMVTPSTDRDTRVQCCKTGLQHLWDLCAVNSCLLARDQILADFEHRVQPWLFVPYSAPVLAKGPTT